ncbi:unnamed protein product [Cladocopium goreaui]|uniref:Uncharacterized protein n=1 Tax=Cladocopium goreaui TaxID=2562237 RepID=A0A9P1CRW3_9DINO|nr:unnamed protein product [Cladocopium goreaui]
MSSICETASTDGEHCFEKSCPCRSQKYVLCPYHKKTFLCNRHRYTGCSQCHLPGRYEGGAAFHSQSSWDAQDATSQCLLVRLKQMISAGDHDTAADQIERQLSELKNTSASARLLKAQLFLEKGHAWHSIAGVDGIQTHEEKTQYLEKAHDAFRTSVEQFQNYGLSKRNPQSYADALLSEANLQARLAKHGEQGDLTKAKKKAKSAERILKRLECSTEGTAIRVLGVIWLTLGDLPKAKQLFLAAIRAFRNSGKELESIWCAVAHWNVHIVLKDLGKTSDSLPWLKRATMLREHIEGPDAPYVKKYHEWLDGLLKELGCEKSKNQKPETMTHAEWKALDLALNAGSACF